VHNFWSNGSAAQSGNFIGLKVVQHFALPRFPPCQRSFNGRILLRKGLANWWMRDISRGGKNGDGAP
jgi:hypothetical protein